MFMYFLFTGINKFCNIAEMCLVCQNPVKRAPLHLEEDLALLRVEGDIDIRYISIIIYYLYLHRFRYV